MFLTRAAQPQKTGSNENAEEQELGRKVGVGNK